MNRSKRLSVASLLCGLLLAACTGRNAVPAMEPEEVLSRAARAVQNLQTARFSVTASFNGGTQTWQTNGTTRLEGMLTDGGDQVQIQVDVHADVDGLSGNYTADGAGEVILSSPEELFVRLQQLSIQPMPEFLKADYLSRFASRWWILASSPGPEAGVATDPTLLQLQSKVVAFSKDLGVEIVNERPTYHYAVRLDTERLIQYLSALAAERGEEFDLQTSKEQVKDLSGEGEMWIDAESFFLHRVEWVLKGIPLSAAGSLDTSFTADIRDHNEEMSIAIPKDAEPYSPLLLLDLPPLDVTGAPVPSPMGNDREIIDEIFRDMQNP